MRLHDRPFMRLGRTRLLVCVVGGLVVFALFHPMAWRLLFRSIQSGSVGGAKFALMMNPAIVGETDYFGDTALALAVEKGNIALVQILLDAGSDMYHEGKRIGSPCHYAAYYGETEMVRLFVERGYDIDHQPRPEIHSGTAMHLACRRGNLATVAYLCENGADVNAISGRGGMTPLMEAMSPVAARSDDPMDRVRIVELLLARGAYTRATDVFGKTALESVREFLTLLPSQAPGPLGVEIGTDRYSEAYLPLKEIERILIERERLVNQD